jgi:hypothetical protein
MMNSKRIFCQRICNSFCIRAALLSSLVSVGTVGFAQAQSNDAGNYHPGQSFTFKPTPGSPSQPNASSPASSTTLSTQPDSSAAPADANDATERKIHWGKVGSVISGAVQGFAGVGTIPSNNGEPVANYASPQVVVPGLGAYVPANALHQSGHIGMPNPAFTNGYNNAPRPGYDPSGHAAGVGLDYNYILSHPPDMSGMPPVRPEFTNTVNMMSDMAAQMGTCGYTDANGWYHPGRPKPQRSFDFNAQAAPSASDADRSLPAGQSASH